MTPLLVLQLALAAVFAVAAIGKLRDRAGTLTAASELGVPSRVVRPVAVLLPAVELATAVLLVGMPRDGAVAALALLSVFSAAILRTLRAGRTPDCHCFGAIGSSAISWRTLARNTGLAVAAGIVAGSLPLAVVALAVGLAGIALSRPRTELSDDSLRVGHQAPGFELTDTSGRTRSLSGLLAPGKPLVLVFADPSCPACTALMPDVADWQRSVSRAATIAVVARGSLEENLEKASAHGLDPILLQPDGAVGVAYGIAALPSAVLIDESGRIASPVARGAPAIRELVVGSPVHGRTLPPVELPTGDGRMVDLSALGGRRHAIVFFSSRCPHCVRLVPALQERTRGPELVLVVPHGEEPPAVDALVLYDDGTAARALGVRGTPSAVLVGIDGRVRHAVARGSLEVRELVQAPARLPLREAFAEVRSGLAGGRITRRTALQITAATLAATAGASVLRPRSAHAHALCDGAPFDPKTQCCTSSGAKGKQIENLADCPNRVPKKDYDPVKDRNGCGPYWLLQHLPESVRQAADSPPGATSFRPACDEHDDCYNTCNADRTACDEAFRKKNHELCDEAYDPDDLRWTVENESCHKWADLYADLVVSYGEGAYDEGQRLSCDCCGCDPFECHGGNRPDLVRCECRCGDGPECPEDKRCCDGKCVDLQTDRKNCGECGIECYEHESCIDGMCRSECSYGCPCRDQQGVVRDCCGTFNCCGDDGRCRHRLGHSGCDRCS